MIEVGSQVVAGLSGLATLAVVIAASRLAVAGGGARLWRTAG